MSRVHAAIIAGNEEKVIHRCLRSIYDHVQGIFLNANGDDGTDALATQFYSATTNNLPWVNFAHNRNLVLDAARKAADPTDYILVGLDADEELVVPEGWGWPDMRLDAYDIEVRMGDSFSFPRTAVVKAGVPWQWRGVIHEGLYCDSGGMGPMGKPVVGVLDDIYIRSHKDGARRSDLNTAQRDLDMLIKAVADEPANPRYQFYLAQQYRFCDRWNPALEAYTKRIGMGGFKQEVWYSRYMIAYLQETVYKNPDSVDNYLNVFEEDPTRAEPLWRAANYAMGIGANSIAFTLANTASLLPLPRGALFIDRDVYTWRCLDVMSAAGWYTPFKQHGYVATARLIAEKKYPAEHAARIEANARLYGIL